MPVALSILIVNYNTREVTLDCLESLYAHPPAVPFEVIMVDNASKDGSAEAFANHYPQVRLIDSKDNLGFAKANNVAALEATGDRMLLLNPDTIVLPGSLDALWAFAQREPERGIWGGRTLFEDGTLNPTSCWGRITLWSLFCSAFGLTWMFPRSRIFNPESYGDWDRGTERPVDIVTGCFLLIDRSLWQQLNGFDPLFFMYAEEADLCLRAKRLRACPAVTPAAEIVHLGGRSEVSHLEKTIKIARGRVTLIRKHWSPVARAVGLALYRVWSLSRMAASRLVPRREQDAPSDWQTIWRRRSEWLNGYSLEQPAGRS